MARNISHDWKARRDRYLQVYELILKGQSTKMISIALGVSYDRAWALASRVKRMMRRPGGPRFDDWFWFITTNCRVAVMYQFDGSVPDAGTVKKAILSNTLKVGKGRVGKKTYLELCEFLEIKNPPGIKPIPRCPNCSIQLPHLQTRHGFKIEQEE